MEQEVLESQTETVERKTLSNTLKSSTFDEDLEKEGEMISQRAEQMTEYCTPCGAYKVKKEALNVCQQCENDFLCAECSENHKFGKLSSTHILMSAVKFVEFSKKETKLCDPCYAKNVKKEAHNVCEQCENEYLCAECSENHKCGRLSSTHILVSAEKFLETLKKGTKLCDPCDARNVKKEANNVCQECGNEFLCAECSDNHKVGKITSSHILVSAEKYVESLKKETKFCDPCDAKNVKKEARDVCQQCDNEFLCTECSDNHRVGKLTRTHDLMSAKKFVETSKKETKLCDPCRAKNVKTEARNVCQQCENEYLCGKCSENHKVGKLTSTHALVSAEKFMNTLKKESQLCDPCGAKNVKKEARNVCQQCGNEFLCVECSENHKVGKLTSTHALVSADKFVETSKKETKLCDPCFAKNVTKEARNVCQQCENELLCTECSENHKVGKLTSTHALVNADKFVETSKKETKLCDPCGAKNVTKEARNVCQQCENELLCTECSENHKVGKLTSTHVLLKTELLKTSVQQEESTSKKLDENTASVSNVQNEKEHNEKTPGRPSASNIGQDTITLAWTKPNSPKECDYYQVSFKKNVEESKWRIYKEDFKRSTVELSNLDTECAYFFRVRGVYGDDEGPYSEVSDIITTLKSQATKLLQFSQPHEQKGVSPTKYALPTKQHGSARDEKHKTRKLEIGAHVRHLTEKTIMMIGETGTGKSTMIDGMVNYILGVKWTDHFRYTVVSLEDEEKARTSNQALSQTEWITTYTIYYDGGSRIPYTINIIDTPGFGDTRGLERDQAIVEQIRGLFSSPPPKGILTIDAVCFLIKAPDARLTTMQRYIFESIMSLFGKDIGNNICALITFADGRSPPVIAALEESKLPFGERFTFNNSGLYASNNEEDRNSLSPMFWEMGVTSFKSFFNHLDTLTQRSLQLTTDVLNERRRIEATVQNLQPKLDAGLMKVDQLKNVIKIFEENEAIIANNKHFTYKEKKMQLKKYELPQGQHVTNCSECTFTCHEKCAYANDDEKRKCSAMDKEGNCTVCPDKCIWNKHANTPHIFKLEEIEVTGTYKDMKQKYELAAEKKLTHEQLLDNMRNELELMANVIEDMMLVIVDCNEKLAEIALRPSPLAMTDHIDLMIEDEKQQKKSGYLARIESLNVMKRRARVLVEGQSFLEQSCTVVSKKEGGLGKKIVKSAKDVFRSVKNVFGF